MYQDMYVLSFWVARVLEFLGIISYEMVDEEKSLGHKRGPVSITHRDPRLSRCSAVGAQEGVGHQPVDGPKGAVEGASLAASQSA